MSWSWSWSWSWSGTGTALAASAQRIKALDRLETYLDHSHEIQTLADANLIGRIKHLCVDLETSNDKIYEAIRQEIQRCENGNGLLDWINEATPDTQTDRPFQGDG